MDLKKWLGRETSGDVTTELEHGEVSLQEVEHEYLQHLKILLARAAIAETCVDPEVRHMGRARDGRDVFTIMIRLTSWDASSAARLLLGLPLLEHNMRRSLVGSWVEGSSRFAGLWVHPSSSILDRSVAADVRSMLRVVAPREDSAEGSMWSTLPP